jgi:autotransporter-associated beta strand protein
LDLSGFSQTTIGAIQMNGGRIQNGTLNNGATHYDLRAGTISANLAGMAGLMKTTSGALTLSGSNTFAGGTTINGGILSINADYALGDVSGRLTLNSTEAAQAVLQTTASFSLAATRPLTVGFCGGAINIAPGTSLTIDLSAATSANTVFDGPLSVQGGGVLNLYLNGSPQVAPTALITIDSGNILNVAGTANPFSDDDTVMDVVNKGILNIISGVETVEDLSGSGDMIISAGATLNATSMVQNTLTIGAGAELIIAPIPGGGPLAGVSPLSPVPEPSAWATLILALMGIGIYRRRGY